MNKNKRLIYISLLAAQGVVITMLERAIPFPFAFAPEPTQKLKRNHQQQLHQKL